MKRFLLFGLPALSLGLLLAQQTPRLNSDFVREIPVRNIAGTFTSGRIQDVAVDPRNRNVWYVATASGGLWKTSNRGISFQPIFDRGGSYSLGCVTVDPKNPGVVWLGTGENQAQRAIGYGDGVYKSIDGGATWKNMGLPNSEHIGKILIDPRDSNHVLVASQGPLFSEGGDRGLYSTSDGGQTWKPLLQISKDTGITDIDTDPRNFDVIYAAAYQRRRHTSQIVAGGPEAAIFKTTDGGAHWNKLTEGIPKVDLGRIALAVSPQKPDVVYALIMTSRKAHQSGMYKSEDGGAHFTYGQFFEVQDPEYYGEIFADPFQFDRVYMMHMNVMVTEDGGKTVKNAGFQIHSDNHALVFDPTDANHLIEGNDGGLFESYDHGRSWRHFNNIPVTQFYRVSVDNGLPFYNIYGGAQDNGSQGVPSHTNMREGIPTSAWMNTGGGDGFRSNADPVDASIVYTCFQGIACQKIDLRTGVTTNIQPPMARARPAEIRSRWDIPFIISPHDHKRLYIAGNRLMRSDDQGANWKYVSEDLTRNIDRETLPVMGKLWGEDAVWKNAFTDEFGTGTALAESPVKEGLLFVGTDDGLVQISEDSGAHWRKIDKFPGVPDMTYVTHVRPSSLDANTVYVSLNNFHRGDFKPYVFKSTDLGRTWTSIAGDLPLRDPVWDIVPDAVNPNLLFAGTEFGMSFSVDGGRHWAAFKNGLPTIPIREMEIQQRESDLVAASFGRGFFVIDDIAALRQLTPEALAADGALFSVGRPARVYDEIGYYRAQGDNIASPNPPFGALLTYYLKSGLEGANAGAEGPKMVLTVTDSGGKEVRRMDASNQAGLHRTAWDLRENAPAGGGGGRGGRGGGGGGRGGRGGAAADDAGGAGAPPDQAAGAGRGRGQQAAAAGEEPPPEEQQAGRGGGRGRGGRGGPLVKPGTYTVTLGRLANGTVTPVGKPQTVQVVTLEASNR